MHDLTPEDMEVCDADSPGNYEEEPEVQMASQHVSAICPVGETSPTCQSRCAIYNTVPSAFPGKTKSSQ